MARIVEEGTYRAYYYKIGVGMLGNYTAYISIPEDTLRRFKDRIEDRVHGGLTWCANGSGAFPDGMKVDQAHRVVGWDYLHNDDCRNVGKWTLESNWTREQVREDIKSVLTDIETMEFRDKNGLEQL